MKKLLSLLLIPFSILANDRTPISCGPETVKSVNAIVQSVKDGDWHTGSTWSTGRVPSETDDITFSHNITATKNIVIRGRLSASRGKITFTGINERNFVGSGMDVLASDVGLWVVGAGQLNLTGTAKTSWTNALGSVTRGSTTIAVTNASGWNIGDEIVIVPTEKPTNAIDWNDATNSPIDPMIAKFERRIISRINGNQISFSQPLQYDHLSVTSTVANRTWTAEVENLTRSIVIEGTKAGRSHIFMMSSKPQTVKFVEGRWLGPRTPGYRSGTLVNGRYGLHFHHCQEGSTGSIVEGNAFHDIGNRTYVPHESDGITFKDNIAHDGMEQMQWWDFQTQSHYITFDHNIQSLRRYNGVNAGSVTGNELNQGDGNVMMNNVAVYIHHGDEHQQAAYAWNTNTVGVWIFIRNRSHSNRTGLFVWQNDNANHTIEDYESYNDELAIHHGAYINEYNYINCIAVNSIVSFEATQGNTNPMFSGYIIDGQGKLDYLVRVLASPVPAGQSNIFVSPTFSGYKKAAILINTELFQGEQGRKVVDVINPKAPDDNIFAFGAKSIYNSMGRVQRNNTAYQVTQQGRTAIAPFATNVYNTGIGLSARYFNGANFERPAFERIDPMVKFQQWSKDAGASPNEVHHRISPGGPYSIVWDGYYWPQASGQTTFAVESFGGVRLTVDGRKILDRWSENNERVKFDAPAVALTVGRPVKVKIEHFNTSGERGIQWYTKQNGFYYNVPISQLYPDTTNTEPEPIPNRPPTVSAGSDVTTYDTLLKIEGSANDPDGNLKTVIWASKTSDLSQTLSDAAHVLVKAKPGTHVLKITASDAAGLTATDEMTLIVQQKVDTTMADPCTVFDPVFYLQYYSDVARHSNYGKNPQLHYEQYGRREGRIINPACVPNFKSKEQKGSTTCLNGQVINVTIPEGKHTAATQALADAQAMQELNAELAKCSQPYATFDIDGKKLYVFKTGDTYQVVIK